MQWPDERPVLSKVSSSDYQDWSDVKKTSVWTILCNGHQPSADWPVDNPLWFSCCVRHAWDYLMMQMCLCGLYLQWSRESCILNVFLEILCNCASEMNWWSKRGIVWLLSASAIISPPGWRLGTIVTICLLSSITSPSWSQVTSKFCRKLTNYPITQTHWGALLVNNRAGLRCWIKGANHNFVMIPAHHEHYTHPAQQRCWSRASYL